MWAANAVESQGGNIVSLGLCLVFFAKKANRLSCAVEDLRFSAKVAVSCWSAAVFLLFARLAMLLMVCSAFLVAATLNLTPASGSLDGPIELISTMRSMSRGLHRALIENPKV